MKDWDLLLTWILQEANIFRYQMIKCMSRQSDCSRIKTNIWNYRHIWEVFTSVKKVKPKYINEIGINYGCLD